MKQLICLLAAAMLACGAEGQRDRNFNTSKYLDIFNNAYRNLDVYYVDTLDAGKLIPRALGYMLAGLDPYTEYYSPDEAESLKTMTTGKYAGIGALIHYYADSMRCCIFEPYDGMPAAKAGLRMGDIIMSIDGKDVGRKGSEPVGDYTQRISGLLRGEAGSRFDIEVKRRGTEELLRFEVTRASIVLQAVPYADMLTDSIGYVKLTTYSHGCASQVRQEVERLKQRGAKAVVIDLQDNGGGLAGEAVDMVNIFVPKNELILSMKGKAKGSNSKYYSRYKPLDTSMPVVVLVNGQSASSSEITCGALQDLDRAVIVGQRTFGKGLVQQTHDLPHGSVIKLTTSHYYIPSGRCIQEIDYAARQRGEGKGVRRPDSLARVFHTRAGREVRDGGGIAPDITVVEDSLPELVYVLQASDRFIDFVADYRNSHDAIGPARDFMISDEDYDRFKAFILASDFKYESRTSQALVQLRKIAKTDGYEGETRAEFDALERKLATDLAKDLERIRHPMKLSLSGSIAQQYYYQRGFYASALNDNKSVDEAVRLLRDHKRYKSLLSKNRK